MMDMTITPKGLFLFREVYHPHKPNLSKIFSYAYITCAVILIACYASDLPGLRCSMDTYVSACETNVVNTSQCDNTVIVDCELDCSKKGLDLGSTCDYQKCESGDACWDTGTSKAKTCGAGCEQGKTGYLFKDFSSITGPSSCTDYLLQQKKISTDAQYSSLPQGTKMGGLKACCGVLKEYEVCLKPSAVIGVIGGCLGLLMSIFQVAYILLARSLGTDVFKKWMGEYHIDDPFMGMRSTKKVKVNNPQTVQHQPSESHVFQTVNVSDVEDHNITHVTVNG